jgi:hypothetical protein
MEHAQKKERGMMELARRLTEQLLGGEPDAAQMEVVLARFDDLVAGQKKLHEMDLANEEPVVRHSLETGW